MTRRHPREVAFKYHSTLALWSMVAALSASEGEWGTALACVGALWNAALIDWSQT